MRDESGLAIDLSRTSDIRLARSSVARLLRESFAMSGDHPASIDTLLATSELVSNALEHTDGPCSLRAWVIAGHRTIRVEVTDRNADAELTASMPSAEHHHGRGLAIVHAVASRWGTDRKAGGKTVWFEVDVPSR